MNFPSLNFSRLENVLKELGNFKDPKEIKPAEQTQLNNLAQEFFNLLAQGPIIAQVIDKANDKAFRSRFQLAKKNIAEVAPAVFKDNREAWGKISILVGGAFTEQNFLEESKAVKPFPVAIASLSSVESQRAPIAIVPVESKGKIKIVQRGVIGTTGSALESKTPIIREEPLSLSSIKHQLQNASNLEELMKIVYSFRRNIPSFSSDEIHRHISEVSEVLNLKLETFDNEDHGLSFSSVQTLIFICNRFPNINLENKIVRILRRKSLREIYKIIADSASHGPAKERILMELRGVLRELVKERRLYSQERRILMLLGFDAFENITSNNDIADIIREDGWDWPKEISARNLDPVATKKIKDHFSKRSLEPRGFDAPLPDMSLEAAENMYVFLKKAQDMFGFDPNPDYMNTVQKVIASFSVQYIQNNLQADIAYFRDYLDKKLYRTEGIGEANVIRQRILRIYNEYPPLRHYFVKREAIGGTLFSFTTAALKKLITEPVIARAGLSHTVSIHAFEDIIALEDFVHKIDLSHEQYFEFIVRTTSTSQPAHMTPVHVRVKNGKMKVIFTDSIGIGWEIKRAMRAFQGLNADIVATSTLRQKSAQFCAIFSLRDVREFMKHPELFDHPLLKANSNAVYTDSLLPPRLYKTYQPKGLFGRLATVYAALQKAEYSSDEVKQHSSRIATEFGAVKGKRMKHMDDFMNLYAERRYSHYIALFMLRFLEESRSTVS